MTMELNMQIDEKVQTLNWVEIDKKAIKYNIRNLKSLTRKRVRFMSVVKSDAYGHGLVEFSKIAVESGADYLGVVNVDEAITLRKTGIKVPIVVLGYVPAIRAQDAQKNDIEIAITSHEQAVELIRQRFSPKLKVHVKVETGINRLGIQKQYVLSVFKELSKSKKIEIEGIYSHLASVEENNLDYTGDQFKEFGAIIESLEKYNFKVKIKHIAASGANLLFPESHFDIVRCGIACYGLWPSEENKKNFYAEADLDTPRPFLKPVLSYKTRVAQVKEVAGGYIGYGCTYRVTRAMRVAILPIGYYEGFDRGLSCASNKIMNKKEQSSCGEVLIAGKRCSVVGRVCMNMTIVDVSKINPKDIHIGDEVVIIGRQDKEKITVEEIADKLGTINYEIISRIPGHIPRFYK